MKKTLVREYKNAHEYNKDAQKLSKQGWSVVQSTDQMKGRSATAKTAIVGSALLTGGLLAPVGIFALTHRKDHLVITYERERPDVSVSPETYKRKRPDVSVSPETYKRKRPDVSASPETYKRKRPDVSASPETYKRKRPDVSVSPETQEVLPEGLSWMQKQQWFNSHRPPGLTGLEFGQWIQNQKRAAKARK